MRRTEAEGACDLGLGEKDLLTDDCIQPTRSIFTIVAILRLDGIRAAAPPAHLAKLLLLLPFCGIRFHYGTQRTWDSGV